MSSVLRELIHKSSLFISTTKTKASPGGSGKESACSAGAAGDIGSIPGLGRSPGGENGNPL